MEKIAIYGAGGFGREVLSLLQNMNETEGRYIIIGFYDDFFSKGTVVNGFEVKGGIAELNGLDEPLSVVIAIGGSKKRKMVVDELTNSNLKFPTIIHPSVLFGSKDTVQIGKGCIICAGVIITTNVVIDDFVLLNLSCTVGHDTKIGAYSSFMPSVNISGAVITEAGVYVGTGAKIIHSLSIGENTIVGAGAVVAKSLPPNCTAVGVPARVIKENS